ncbi:MAG TPA: hypothetical protein VGD99_18945 [Anaerolineae bacterium]
MGQGAATLTSPDNNGIIFHHHFLFLILFWATPGIFEQTNGTQLTAEDDPWDNKDDQTKLCFYSF